MKKPNFILRNIPLNTDHYSAWESEIKYVFPYVFIAVATSVVITFWLLFGKNYSKLLIIETSIPVLGFFVYLIVIIAIFLGIIFINMCIIGILTFISRVIIRSIFFNERMRRRNEERIRELYELISYTNGISVKSNEEKAEKLVRTERERIDLDRALMMGYRMVITCGNFIEDDVTKMRNIVRRLDSKKKTIFDQKTVDLVAELGYTRKLENNVKSILNGNVSTNLLFESMLILYQFSSKNINDLRMAWLFASEELLKKFASKIKNKKQREAFTKHCRWVIASDVS